MPKMGPMLLKCGPQSRSGHIEFTKEKAFGVEGNCSFLLKKKKSKPSPKSSTILSVIKEKHKQKPEETFSSLGCYS